MLLTLVGRRTATALLMASVLRPSPAPAAELVFKDAGPEGFQYADSKLGSGSPPVAGQRVAIDYVMSTTGARYGAKIDSTVDRQAPYAWTLGDGSTIKGLELAITGDGELGPRNRLQHLGPRCHQVEDSLSVADTTHEEHIGLLGCGPGGWVEAIRGAWVVQDSHMGAAAAHLFDLTAHVGGQGEDHVCIREHSLDQSSSDLPAAAVEVDQ